MPDDDGYAHDGYGVTVNFWSLYQHGFARIAACTGHAAIADPPANAEAVLRLGRRCAEEGSPSRSSRSCA